MSPDLSLDAESTKVPKNHTLHEPQSEQEDFPTPAKPRRYRSRCKMRPQNSPSSMHGKRQTENSPPKRQPQDPCESKARPATPLETKPPPRRRQPPTKERWKTTTPSRNIAEPTSRNNPESPQKADVPTEESNPEKPALEERKPTRSTRPSLPIENQQTKERPNTKPTTKQSPTANLLTKSLAKKTTNLAQNSRPSRLLISHPLP